MRPNVIYPSDGSGSETPRRVTAKQFEIFCKLDNQNLINWAAVLRRAKSHPSDILLREDVHGDTPLHAAFRSGDPPVDVILALQAASRLKNDSGATPLHIAASHRCSVDAMRALLECGANWKEASPCVDTNNVGRTPAHSACMSFRNLEMSAFMLLLDQTLKEGFISVDKGREHEPTLGFEDEDDYLNDSYNDFDVEKCEKVVRNVMTVRDSRGMTPLALLFGRYRQRVRRVITDIDASRAGNKDAPEHAALVSAMRVHRELGELWDKARRIVTRLTEARLEHEGIDTERYMPQSSSPASDEEQKRAAAWAYEQHRGREPTEDDVLPVYVDVADRESSLSPVLNETVSVARQFRIVHSSVGLIGYGCPPEMIRLAISIHPHQVSEMDEDGNLPLHIAAKASSFLGRYNDVMSANAAAAVIATNFSDDASIVSETASFFSSITVSQTTNPFDKVIKMLLQHYPKAAETPQGETGQLPLIMAMKAGQRSWTDGIRTLLNAYPAALHRSKAIAPVLYPHVLALVTNSNEIDETKLERHPFLRDKQIRQDNHSRTTLFEFLQANPEWLTGEDGDEQS